MSFKLDTFVLVYMVLVMFTLCLCILTTRPNKIITLNAPIVPAVLPAVVPAAPELTPIPGREINSDINFGTMDNNNAPDKSLINEEPVVVGDVKIENFGNIFAVNSRDR